MKPKSKVGRVAVTVAISMTRQEAEWMDERVRELGARVANRSHYVRLLLEADRHGQVILPELQARASAGLRARPASPRR